MHVRVVASSIALASLVACARSAEAPRARAEWAIAIHGGAGTIPRTMDPAQVAAYEEALRRALALGRDGLSAGKAAVDVVEEVARQLEDEPLFNAGKGAVFTHDGTHELDASIMDGSTLACGAVAGVKTVRHPISLARLVMDKTKHVLLAGDGADRFGRDMGVELVDNTWFDTDRRREQWRDAQTKEAAVVDAGPTEPADAGVKGTIGVVALDRRGHLAAATSTGGLTNKRWGRVGDSPVVGAGTYANDATAAISCTGTGEEFIRHGVARTVSSRMALLHEDVEAAGKGALAPLKPGDGGLIALDTSGRIAFVFSTDGMYRAAADAGGRFEVAIWR